MPIPLRPAAATLCLAASLLAQCPPGAPMPQDVSLETNLPTGGPAHLRVQTGIAARDAGDLAAARQHFEAALEFHPSSPEVLLELLCSCGDDQDLLAHWGERFGLDLLRQPAGDLDSLLLLPTRGIPLDANGTFVLWLPKMAEGSPTDRLGRSLRALSGYLGDRLQYPQRWVMAVPKCMPKDERDDALAALADMRGDAIAVVEHDITKPFDDDEPWLLFVDGAGVLRKAASARSPKLSVAVRNWARHLRQRR